MKAFILTKRSAVFLHIRSAAIQIILILAAGSVVFGQNAAEKTPEAKPSPVPNVTAGSSDPKQQPADKGKKSTNTDLTAEQIAESVIFIYGGGLGRINLDQIRKTTIERGKLAIIDGAGKTEQAKYGRWVQRGENQEKDRVRLDTEFPNSKFGLISAGDKVFGIYNNQVFTPREDAVNDLKNGIFHSLEALLRYKENGSSLELIKRDEKIMGVNFNVIDVVDKQRRKTRFYVSVKSFRVMMLEYTEGSINYRRKFYDYNYAQGTLVPYRTVLWAGDKKVEESTVQTITFGQKVEDNIFAGS